MGGESSSASNLTFLRVTKGKMVNKNKNIEWDKYTGYIVGLGIKDGEYEGKPTKQVEVKMKDDKSDEIVIIQFTLAAWYAQGFFARIFKVDVSKPFTLAVSASDENEKMSFCWMRQEGQSYVNRDGKKVDAIQAHPTFPRPKQVDVGAGQTITSWADVIPSMEKVIAQVQKSIAEKGIKVEATVAPVSQAKAETAPEPEPWDVPVATAPTERPPVVDDLPF